MTTTDEPRPSAAYSQPAPAPRFAPPSTDTAAGSPRPGSDDAHVVHGGGRGSTSPVPGPLRAAAIASLGAGAIHATAAGAHAEHRSAAVAFAVVAALQIGWGAVALARSGRVVAFAGVAINGAALGGWILAKTSGISFIDGLEEKEPAQFADTVAAGLGVVAVLGALLALASRVEWVARPRPVLVGLAGLATLALAVPGMVATGEHGHAGGHDETATAGDAHDDGGAAHGDEGHEAASQPPEPYDATLPVNLGGVEGVSAEQQAEAEALVTETLETLEAEYGDWTTLEERGWYSIGDAISGHEHFINWPLLEDGKTLDPSVPESLVFEVNGDQKKLVAAMFMLSRSVGLDEVPDFGGALVQWHNHDNLCYAGVENQWRVAGIVPAEQECPAPTFRLAPHPAMIHVWITPHPCGPFAALEGAGAGSIPEGEERLCDAAHGDPAAGH